MIIRLYFSNLTGFNWIENSIEIDRSIDQNEFESNRWKLNLSLTVRIRWWQHFQEGRATSAPNRMPHVVARAGRCPIFAWRARPVPFDSAGRIFRTLIPIYREKKSIFCKYRGRIKIEKKILKIIHLFFQRL